MKISVFLKSDDIFAVRQPELPKILYTKIRQHCYGTSPITMLTISEDLKILSKKKLTPKKMLLNNIVLGVKYFLYHVSNDHFPPIETNFSDALQGIFYATHEQGFLKFKVADKSALYKITMDANIHNYDKKLEFADIWTDSGAKIKFEKGASSITLNSVKPDKDGVININVTGGTLFLTTLLVTKETSK